MGRNADSASAAAAEVDSSKLTPAMRQYMEIRAAYPFPEYTLLFQMGDFYELFFEDAERIAEELGLHLTKRGKVGEQDVPLAGFPMRALQSHLTKLLTLGHKVIVVEQTQDAKEAKGVVERDITRIVTPGTITDEDGLVEEYRENFVAAVLPPRTKRTGSEAAEAAQPVGLAFAELSTGRFELACLTRAEALRELARLEPAEVLWPEWLFAEMPEGGVPAEREPLMRGLEEMFAVAPVMSLRGWIEFDAQNSRRRLLEHFGVESLRGFGCEGREAEPAVAAAGALLGYLRETQRERLGHIVTMRRLHPGATLVLDPATRRCLELTETLRTREVRGSLIGVVDRTATPMGSRLLREWLLAPLANRGEIRRRQGAVQELLEETTLRRELRAALKGLGDLERLASRVGYGRATARDLAAIRDALARLPALKNLLVGATSELLAEARGFDPLSEVHARLEATLNVEPPGQLKEGGLIRDGANAELDELRSLSAEGDAWIAEYQAREIEASGIASLKVGFNKVFGYYIEISHANRDKVPASYERKQTLKGAERYVTPQLKEFERKVLRADERSKELEYELFLALRDELAGHVAALLDTARKIALFDVLLGLAELAESRRYCRPEMVEEPLMEVRGGRHPVIEAMPGAQAFVPNDCLLAEAQPAQVITGPNMAGKSTYIRQVALIALLAHVGSFVPAESARIGLVDRIFTRLGSADELARGQSTFMVEMTETANILNHATSHSLVILDEIGRGTSTFDGVAIAWSAMEHLVERLGCRTLFATHYHELTGLAEVYEQVCNVHVSVAEHEDEVVFLHQIVEGGTDKSYGIHVGRLAGLPPQVIARAKEILKNLEAQSLEVGGTQTEEPQAESTDKAAPRDAQSRQRLKADATRAATKRQVQLTLFVPAGDEVYAELQNLDINALTPLEALAKLEQLQQLAKRIPE